MKLINPFGPKIAVLKIPKNLIKKINNEEVRVSVLHSGVGAITESDVILA